MTPGGALRILVVEDSAVQRAAIVSILEAAGMEVVGSVADVAGAVRAVAALRPDLVTMDLDIPGGGAGLGGLEAIRRIMDATPTPILVLSAHAPSRAALPAIEALDAGAIDVLPKDGLADPAAVEQLRRRIGILARVPMVRRHAGGPPATRRPDELPVVALAASTGGPTALRGVVAALRGVAAPILVVQHIHRDFVDGFARWLQDATLVPVVVARDGEPARPGVVHVAPGDAHLCLAADRVLRLEPEPDSIVRPSADELLRSVARHAGRAGVGAVLTGMGHDGAAGLLELRRAGGRTLAQDGASATVDGMPRAARDCGAAERALPLAQIGPAIAGLVRANGGGRG